MTDQCFFLGILELPGGSCAQWFSGFASTAAVIVALAANFYAAWRQAKKDQADDCVEVAGASMNLRLLLQECYSNTDLFYDGCKLVAAYEEEFFISQPLGAVKAGTLPLLTARQADVLIRNNMGDFAEETNLLIGEVNLMNLGIEDYSKQRVIFSPNILKYFDKNTVGEVDRSTDDFKKFRHDLGVLSNGAEQFVKRSKSMFEKSILLADRFNSFCQSNKRYRPYSLSIDNHRKDLASLAIKRLTLEKKT